MEVAISQYIDRLLDHLQKLLKTITMNLNIKASVVVFAIGIYPLFTGCQKNTAADRTITAATKINTPQVLTQAIQDARLTMATRLSASDYGNLDWQNAAAWKSSEAETTVNVKSKTETTVSLTFVTSSNMKLYKWQQEVHFIVN